MFIFDLVEVDDLFTLLVLPAPICLMFPSLEIDVSLCRVDVTFNFLSLANDLSQCPSAFEVLHFDEEDDNVAFLPVQESSDFLDGTTMLNESLCGVDELTRILSL